MARMTGGQALARSLHREGVRAIFALPGVQLYHATIALAGEPEICVITTRHEQATAYMADGYARAGGGIGTALVVPGPGLLNATAGIGTAYAASSPVLVVSGQIERHLIGARRGVLHEIDGQLDCVGPISKWTASVLDPAEIPAAVREAFRQLRTGRPRPVVIEVPPETLAEEADVELLDPAPVTPAVPHPDQVRAAARVLAAAKSVLIWAGGGVIAAGGGPALLQVAEFLQAPVLTTPEGKGAIPEDHYLCLGTLRAGKDPFKPRLAEFDAVLAVGTRFATFGLRSGPQVVQIDIDPEEVGRNYPGTLGLVGDAAATLAALAETLQELGPGRPGRRAELDALRAERRQDPWTRTEPVAELVAALRRAIPADGILVPDLTQVSYYSRVLYPVYQPRTYLTSSYFGTLGFAFPTALGAKVACPNRAVVSISGDGGFLYCVQELATAVRYGIHVVAVVFNDHAYGNVMRDLAEQFGAPPLGTDLHNPDFMQLAAAFGARGVRAEGPAALEAAVREALATPAVTLIEAPIQRMVPSAFR